MHSITAILLHQGHKGLWKTGSTIIIEGECGMIYKKKKKNVVFFTNNLLKCHFNPDCICDVKVLNCQYETCKYTTRLQFCYHMNNAKYHSTLNSIKCKPELHRI